MDIVKVDLLFKLAGIGILIMVFTQVLNQAEKKEQAQLLTLAGVVVVMMFIVKLIGDLFNTVRSIFNIY
ncbi:MAG: stage III sporulation protein AC [Eubacteriales bacterium]|nr:stage III sporulation protein AC [Eubacteriales bacterium]MDD3073479.1 stage III sporulation protein AC [Eubacteriales bacterium]MDD4078746.1 stage III sporulation protein AC [Eubacteriales bacterium]MDD4768342.1 stage III sporulation protein AC [Eubacteriales bacterium]